MKRKKKKFKNDIGYIALLNANIPQHQNPYPTKELRRMDITEYLKEYKEGI